MKSATSLLIVFALLPAWPGLIRHDRSDEAYRALATQPAFDAVVPIRAGKQTVGSAVLLTPSWVLTAYHVLRNAGVQVDVVIGDEAYRPFHVIRHPGAADLALIQLPQPVSGHPVASLYRDSLELNQRGITVGFGVFGTGDETMRTVWDTHLERAGIKRAGENMIDALPQPDLLQADFDHPDDPRYSTLGDAAALNLEYFPMRGDSGGGLFIEVDGHWQLAGITVAQKTPSGIPQLSSNIFDNIGYGWLAQWHRVSHFTDWIDQHIAETTSQSSSNR